MTKLIPILSDRALVVELPEGATKPEIYGRSLTFDTPIEVDEWGYDYQAVKLPKGNWRIIGMLSEVTDEQAKGTVDEPYESGIEQYTEPDDLTGWIVSEAPMGTKYSKVMYR